MTDVVTSTSGAHQEQHTDDSSQDVDVATDTRRSENDGENGESRRDLNDRNPEPPAELLEERILDAGNIGGTMFSKHWLFTTLMKLIQAVDSENESKDAKTTSDDGLDLEESLQDELCNLWDMSMNPDVVTFLQDFKAVDILAGVIAKSRAPRATEICVGILGNMACDEQACREITTHSRLVELLLMLLESPDAPTLIELTRLLRVCISMDAMAKTWTTAIKKTDSVFPSVLFILQSSTNNDLLRNLAEFVDKLMDIDDEVIELWGTPEMVQAVLEAVKQVRDCVMYDASLSTRSRAGGTFDMFLHILQMVSTCEAGVHALVDYAGMVCDITQQYLVTLCSDDVLVVSGRERGIGSAVSILCAVFSGWNEKIILLKSDYHLMHCSLKILHVLSPHARRSSTHKRRRSRKTSTSIDSSSSATHDEECPATIATTATESGQGEGKGDGSGRDKELGERVGVGARPDVEDDIKETLREVVRSLLVHIISALSQDALSTDTQSDSENSQDGDTAHRLRVPETLDYLDSMCPHERIACLVRALRTASDETRNEVAGLTDLAVTYGLERLQRIVEETLAS